MEEERMRKVTDTWIDLNSKYWEVEEDVRNNVPHSKIIQKSRPRA